MDDDVQHKAKPVGDTWGSATPDVVAGNEDQTDDHCFQAFNHEDYLFTVYHRNNGGDNEIRLRFDDFSSGSWAVVLPTDVTLDLPSGHTDADDPTISTNLGAISTNTAIVAKSSTDDAWLLDWTCAGTKADCDTSAEWVERQTALTGDVSAPQVLVTPSGTVVLYEDVAAGEIRVAKMCTFGSSWSYVDKVPRPVGYDRVEFAGVPKQAAPVLVRDPAASEDLRAVFLARKTNTQLWDPVKWTVDITDPDLCP